MTYPKLLKLCLPSSSRKKYDLSLQSQLLFNVNLKSAVDEVQTLFSRGPAFLCWLFQFLARTAS